MLSMAIMTALAIASFALTLGMTVKDVVREVRNQNLRQAISKTITTIADSLKSGRLNANQLLSALQSRNSLALQQALYGNPLITKTLAELQKEAVDISELSAALNQVENNLSQYQAEMSSLGLSSTASHTGPEAERFEELKKKVAGEVEKHHEIEGKIAAYKSSPYREFKVDTSHLDAITQNLKGGQQ